MPSVSDKGMDMDQATDKERGIKAIEINPGEVMKFARMKYNGTRGYWMPYSSIPLCDFVSFQKKSDAIGYAKSIGWAAATVTRIGSRFWTAWGFQRGAMNEYFLANFE